MKDFFKSLQHILSVSTDNESEVGRIIGTYQRLIVKSNDDIVNFQMRQLL